jgi:hypothetical protein
MGRPTRLLIVVLTIGAVLGGPLPIAGQGELVIVKEGTKLYHRAGCPAIADGKDVLALTRAQADSRGYDAHAECDPDKQREPAGKEGPKKPADTTVYLDGTRYYHRRDCRRLSGKGDDVKPAVLEVAGKSHWPCPACKPPVRRRGTEPAVPGTGRRGG